MYVTRQVLSDFITCVAYTRNRLSGWMVGDFTHIQIVYSKGFDNKSKRKFE